MKINGYHEMTTASLFATRIASIVGK